MVTINSDGDNSKSWYLGTSYSNHMTRHRDWLLDFDVSVRNKVKFTNNNTIIVERMGKVVIKRKDGKYASVTYVLYVPSIKTNLLNLGKLLEKGFLMSMKENDFMIFVRRRGIYATTYVLNIYSTRRIRKMTPKEAWSEHTPIINHLRFICSVCYRHIIPLYIYQNSNLQLVVRMVL
uniref:Retrovirus-related Pol polyprotein from transposon TNT 1-94-like beta-barrel domain-containing protein n=1 Tax=Cajanus cajan TaxID=3821 RepID=A0A151T852_CAJCA|nr:hypothetical protein KK1_017809 [Cajanus cajan]